MLYLKSFCFNPFQQNTYLLYDNERTAFIIDPGNYTSSENTLLKNFIEEKQLKLTRLLLTHAHIDHILGNKFIFENYGLLPEAHEEEVFFTERRKLKDQAKREIDFKIVATDISEDAIDISIKNARTAGVDHLIDFSVCDFADTEVPEGPGVVMFNPEYGERLGVHSKLEATYKRIGDFMKQKCKGYRGYIFTGNPDLAKKIGLRADRRIEFYNGKLDCRLLEYELYEGSKREPKPAE